MRFSLRDLVFIGLLTFKLSEGKLIDLSYSLSNETVHWPTASSFSFTNMIAKFISDGFWYAMNDFCSGEHLGTHIDAPYHFNKDGLTVDKLPIDDLVVKLYGAGIAQAGYFNVPLKIEREFMGFLLDVSTKALHNSSYEVSVDDLNELKAKIEGGRFSSKSVLLIRTGWSKYWPDAQKYLGHKTDTSKLKFPGLGIDAAKLIADDLNIVGLGIDTASMDYGQSLDFMVHRTLQARGKYLLENVASLDELVNHIEFKLTVMPMKIKGGTGAPCRIFVDTNDNESSRDEF